MTEISFEKLKSTQKCAVVLIALGVDRASRILAEMTDAEVTKISYEIAKLENLSTEVLNSVIGEYYKLMISNQYVAQGGKDFTREILEKTWSSERAENFIQQLHTGRSNDVFEMLERIDAKVLASVLMHEHPQTNALILANLSAPKSASLLEALPQESQNEIAFRLATMKRTSPELLEEVKSALSEQLKFALHEDPDKVGGIETVADILNSISGTIEKNIIAHLRKREPNIAAAISELMFSFDDVVLLSDKAIQRLLKDVDSKKVALGLKAASDDLKEKILKNMSERAAKMLKDDIEFLGAVRLKDVEDAQREIVEIVKQLEESGEITISRGEEELVA